MSQTPAETFVAVRAVVAWFNAIPDAVANVDGRDSIVELCYEAIEDILAYDPITRNAVELLQHRDEKDERAANPELYDTDVLDSSFWDRVEGKE